MHLPRGWLAGNLFAALLCVTGTVSAQSQAAVEAPPFQIRVTLTSWAAEVLRARGERLRTFGYYFGAPKPGVKARMGEVDLGNGFDLTNQPLRGVIEVPRKRLNRAALEKIEGSPLLLINVVSARRSSPDNLLSCDFYQGPIASMPAQTVALHCGLIAEGLPTQMLKTFQAAGAY